VSTDIISAIDEPCFGVAGSVSTVQTCLVEPSLLTPVAAEGRLAGVHGGRRAAVHPRFAQPRTDQD